MYCISFLPFREQKFRHNSLSLKKLSDFLPSIMQLSRMVIIGDFKIHIDNDCNLFAKHFISIMESFHFT